MTTTIATIKISEMTGKMKNIPAINTNPLDNPFCNKMACSKSVCKHCYSRAMLNGLRKNCGPAWSMNGKILSESILSDDSLPTINSVWFRFSGHGELINRNHFVNLCNIARKNPRTHFVLWSKRTDLVRKNIDMIPPNMRLIYSNPRINNVLSTAPKGFDKVFNVIDDKSKHASNCAGKACWECGICYKPENTTVCVIEKLRTSKSGASYNHRNGDK